MTKTVTSKQYSNNSSEVVDWSLSVPIIWRAYQHNYNQAKMAFFKNSNVHVVGIGKPRDNLVPLCCEQSQ